MFTWAPIGIEPVLTSWTRSAPGGQGAPAVSAGRRWREQAHLQTGEPSATAARQNASAVVGVTV